MPLNFIEPLESRQLLSTSSTSISVNTSNTSQTIRGMGGDIALNARFDGRGISDQNTAYALSHLSISTVRVAINLMGWMPNQLTSTSTSSINWNQFVQSSTTTKEFKQLQGFQKSGMLIVASIFDAPNWLVTNPQDKQHRRLDSRKYADFAYGIAAWLLRAKEQYGITISNISVNESNAGFNIYLSDKVMPTFIPIAGPMFAKMGLGSVKWDMGDDGFVTVDSFVKPILEDKAIAPYLGPIAWHSWNLDDNSDGAFSSLANIAKQYGKEIWATEVGYDPLLQFNDPQAFATFGNAIQDAEMYLRSLKVLHCTVMQYWDFGNDFPIVNPANNQPYPDYYIVKSYQDNLKPGSVIVQANSSDSKILSIAAKDTKNNHFFAQAIDEHTSGTQTVTFTGLPNEPLTLTQSDPKENGKVIGTYTPKGGKLTLTLPANSVSTLSGKYTGSTSSGSTKKAVATANLFADSSGDSKSKISADVLE